MLTATWREIREILKISDLCLEVLDARVPPILRSEKLERLVEKLGKKLIIVINKADLTPRNVCEAWKVKFEGEGVKTVYISATKRLGTKKLRSSIKEVGWREIKEKGKVRVCVVGFPKVGKSSIVNVLKGRSSAKTSPIPGSPGYTKRFQFYRVSKKVRLIDTPGILPISKGNPLIQVIRGLNPMEMDVPSYYALPLLEFCERIRPGVLREIYGIEFEDAHDFLRKLAMKRGWLRKDEVFEEKAARSVIMDWHRGKIKVWISPKNLKELGSLLSLASSD